MTPYPPLPPGRSRIHVPLIAVVVGAFGAIVIMVVAIVWAIIRLYGWLTG